jgi:hypothetical protein
MEAILKLPSAPLYPHYYRLSTCFTQFNRDLRNFPSDIEKLLC